MFETYNILHLLFVFFACFFYVIYFNKQSIVHNTLKQQLGGPSGLPLIGNTLALLKNKDRLLYTFSEWIVEYGGRFVVNLGPWISIVVVNEAEDLETILSSKSVTDKSGEYAVVKSWLENGLITSSGQYWAHRRKLLTPAFHFSILERFVGPVNDHARILLKILTDTFSVPGEPTYRDIAPFIARCTLDIICDTAMGKQVNAQFLGTSEYVEAIHDLGELFTYRTFRPWLRSDIVWNLSSGRRREVHAVNVIRKFTDDVIAERKQTFKQGLPNLQTEDENFIKTRLAFLDLLLEAQRTDATLTDKGIREETTTFIFAGHDTLSVAVSFCLFNIGNHPDVQVVEIYHHMSTDWKRDFILTLLKEKLHRELDMIFKGDHSRDVTPSDIKEMKYLECCIKESLRLYPSVPVIGRHVKSPLKLHDNVTIPPGVTIYVFPYKVQRNSKQFPKPDEFIPERFAVGSCMANRNPFAYIPFSAGPRNCIGKRFAIIEAKILLATILRRFKIKSEKRPEDIVLLPEIVLRPKGGIMLQLEERK